MSFRRIAVCLVALTFLLASPVAAGDSTYSGVPGKFRRSTKADKEKAAQEEAKKEQEKKNKINAIKYSLQSG